MNTLHHHLSQKARKTISKKLMVEEELKDACLRSPSRNSSNIARGLYFSSEETPVTPEPSIHISALPYEVQTYFLSFLTPTDLLKTVQPLSRQWREAVLDSYTWKLVQEAQGLTLGQRVRRVQCIAERRSKGKLFKCVDRLTGERYTLRVMFLDVTNAGRDDGFPTSVLRELSHLKSLEHPT